MKKFLILAIIAVFSACISAFSQNVGISPNISFVPQKTLDVDGNTHIFGQLGVGTLNPSHKLHVVGGIRTTSGFIANDGTANTPSYRFNDGGSMGMYRAAANELGFSTNSTEWLRISSAGIVRLNAYTTNGIVRTTGGIGTLTTTGGLVTVSEGGTGVGTLTGVVIGNGASAMNAVSGAANQFLRRNAANTAYEFATLTPSTVGMTDLTFNSSGSGAVSGTAYNGSTAYTISYNSIGAVGGSGTANYLSRWITGITLGNGTVQDNGSRIGVGAAPHASYRALVAGDVMLTSGWLRTTGSTGWYNETHAGGWYMTDATWIRSYNSKDVYINTFLRADGGITSGAVVSSGAGTMRATNFITSDVGFRISNIAANGTFLRGNGTNYVSSTILASDVPSGSGNYIQNQIGSAQTGAGFWTAGTGRVDAFGVNNTSSTTGKGISLYNGPTPGQPDYGIMFAGTGTFGTHGYVSADWATYFTMNTTANRGWVFRSGTTNVASVNNAGNMSINGRLRLGNVANTELYSNGTRIYARSEGVDGVAEFASYGMYMPRTGQTYNLYLGGKLKIGHNEAGWIDINDVNTRIEKGNGNSVRLRTNSGFIDVGAQNTSFAHIYTDRPAFYMDKGLYAGSGNTLLNVSTGNSFVNGGNFGIGTTGPTRKLEVIGDTRITGYHYINNASPSIIFQDSDQRSGVIHVNSNLMYFLSGNGTNGTSWAINGSYWPLTINLTNDIATFGGQAHFMEGNVGIGTTTPLTKLHSLEAGATAPAAFFNISSTTSGYNAMEGGIAHSGTTFAPAAVMGLAAYNGTAAVRNVGVLGHTNNWRGTGVRGSRTNNGGTNDGWGGLFLSDLGYTGGFFNASDSRLKTGVRSLDNALVFVERLRPVRYHYDTDKYPHMGLNTSEEFGFIAQEVYEIFPDIIKHKSLPLNGTNTDSFGEIRVSDEDTFMMMDYIRLIPLLTQAIKEQQTMILELKDRIVLLEKPK